MERLLRGLKKIFAGGIAFLVMVYGPSLSLWASGDPFGRPTDPRQPEVQVPAVTQKPKTKPTSTTSITDNNLVNAQGLLNINIAEAPSAIMVWKDLKTKKIYLQIHIPKVMAKPELYEIQSLPGEVAAQPGELLFVLDEAKTRFLRISRVEAKGPDGRIKSHISIWEEKWGVDSEAFNATGNLKQIQVFNQRLYAWDHQKREYFLAVEKYYLTTRANNSQFLTKTYFDSYDAERDLFVRCEKPHVEANFLPPDLTSSPNHGDELSIRRVGGMTRVILGQTQVLYNSAQDVSVEVLKKEESTGMILKFRIVDASGNQIGIFELGRVDGKARIIKDMIPVPALVPGEHMLWETVQDRDGILIQTFREIDLQGKVHYYLEYAVPDAGGGLKRLEIKTPLYYGIELGAFSSMASPAYFGPIVIKGKFIEMPDRLGYFWQFGLMDNNNRITLTMHFPFKLFANAPGVQTTSLEVSMPFVKDSGLYGKNITVYRTAKFVLDPVTKKYFEYSSGTTYAKTGLRQIVNEVTWYYDSTNGSYTKAPASFKEVDVSLTAKKSLKLQWINGKSVLWEEETDGKVVIGKTVLFESTSPILADVLKETSSGLATKLTFKDAAGKTIAVYEVTPTGCQRWS